MKAKERDRIAQSLLKEIERQLKGPTKSASFLSRYIGAQGHEKRKPDEQSKLVYWGHSMPTLRSVAKTQSLKELSLGDQWSIWRRVWNLSTNFDVRSVVLIWLSGKYLKDIRVRKARDLQSLAPDIDNWALSDGLSSMLAEVLENSPAHWPLYVKWNRSKNPWLRRQSLVGIYYYVRLRKKRIPASQALKLTEALLDDSHFYVQRGVGWILREIDRVDSLKQRAFVRKHLNRISGVAWFATSELYPLPLRKELVTLRKKSLGKKAKK